MFNDVIPRRATASEGFYERMKRNCSHRDLLGHSSVAVPSTALTLTFRGKVPRTGYAAAQDDSEPRFSAFARFPFSPATLGCGEYRLDLERSSRFVLLVLLCFEVFLASYEELDIATGGDSVAGSEDSF